MSLIQIKELTFAYDNGQDNVFDSVSINLDTNWRMGLIGRNGSGKTTFLRILCGELAARGIIGSSVNFEYFPFNVKDEDIETIDIVRDICGAELWRIQRECSLLDVVSDVLYRPFSTLSGGERTKIMLAALFLKDDAFLLIDEPTNHLDFAGRQIVAKYLNAKQGFILVSHDRHFLDGCINYVLSIQKNGQIILSRGNYTIWHANKTNQDNFELEQNQKLKTEIDKLSTAARQKSSWSNSAEKEKYGQRGVDKGYLGRKAAKIMKSAKVLEAREQKAIEQKKQLLKNVESIKQLTMFSLNHHSDLLISVKNLNISYASRQILHDFNLEIRRGEKVFLRGGNGSGKTSILKAILEGNYEIYRASDLIISYISQRTEFLQGDLMDFAQENHLNLTDFLGNLDRLGLNREDMLNKNIFDMSNGQKKKVLIAKSLTERAHLYIWDEPLNYIDILSRIQIENLLKQSNAAMLIVEHDLAFCNNLADKIVEL